MEKLAQDQHKHFDTLLSLTLATADLGDPKHLKKLDDGGKQYAEAVEAIEILNLNVTQYRKLQSESEEAQRRRRVDLELAQQRQETQQKLDELRHLFFSCHQMTAQARGYELERILNQLFQLHEIDAKGSFRTQGEQIDGAFTLEGTEFLLEAKWQKEQATTGDLAIFSRKVERKLDNTLGLFVAMSGFHKNAIDLTTQGTRPTLLLADGQDLMLVLEGRLSLQEMISRKKQHAARTGEIYFPSRQIFD